MSAPTNELVATLKRSLAPAAIASTLALGAVLAFNHNGVHAAAMTASPLDDHSVAALTSLDQAMESVAARVTPAVVNIAVTSRSPQQDISDDQLPGQMQDLPPGLRQFFGDRFGRRPGPPQRPLEPQLEHGIGSGVIISADGYILTNDHVVDGAKEIRVTLHDRRILKAKLVGVDRLTDLAVVKVDARDLPAISWGNSESLVPGQTVLAFGSPFGYFQFSVTRGIVSAVNRPNPYSDDARKPGGYIQTDAAINPGNSGGPLVNAHGELVGINTFIISNNGSFAGAGFAIPSQIARATTEQLIKTGKVEHGYLGIGLNDVTPDNARFFNLQDAAGAIVAQVTPGSPASRAGLLTGDVIRKLNGQQIANGSALQLAVSGEMPGTKIELGILRDGKPMTLNLTVGQFNGKNNEAASNDDEQAPKNGKLGSGKLGLSVGDLTADSRQQIDAPDQVHGAVVQNVRPGSPAEDAGLQPGDIILEVDRHPTTTANQFVSAVRQNPAGKDILLLVWSKGNASYRTVHTDQGDQKQGDQIQSDQNG